MVQDGYTALMLSAVNGHDGVVDLLIKAGASLDVQEEVGGHGWWTRRNHPLTHLTLGPPIGPGPAPSLLPHGDRHELLLTPPSCPLMVQTGYTALTVVAAVKGHDSIADLLLKAGASPDVQDEVGGHGWWTRRIHPLTHPTLAPPIGPGLVPPLLPHGGRPELL